MLTYFISFMQMTNLLFLNLIISFVIDTFTSIELTLQEEKRQKEMAQGGKKDDDDDKSLLRELNDNPGQFTRIMSILNSSMRKNQDEEGSPMPMITDTQDDDSRPAALSISGESFSNPSFRSSILSPNSKEKRRQNESELKSFYKRLRGNTVSEESEEESGSGSDVTSEMETELFADENEALDKHMDEEDGIILQGSIYQKAKKKSTFLRRARTTNLQEKA